MQRLINIFLFFSFIILLNQSVVAKNTDQGLFFLPAGTDKIYVAPVLKTTVNVEIEGMLITTTFRQHYINPSKEWVEAIYLFPLPDTSIVDKLRVKIGQKYIEGKIKEKKQAEKIYDIAKKKGQKASLVSQTNKNIFRTNLANIGPGESISVEIEFQDHVKLKDDTYSFRLPTVIAPKYFDNNSQKILDKEFLINIPRNKPTIFSPIREPSLPSINPYEININLKPGFLIENIKGLYHDIIVDKISENYHKISLKNKKIPSTRDFVLTWNSKLTTDPQISLFGQEWKNDFYIFGNFFPPTDKSNYKPISIPKDIILVLDNSGSMSGSSMRQLKKSLHDFVDIIDQETRINFITFSDNYKIFLPEPIFTTQTNKILIHNFIDSMKGEGGTNILPAINASLQFSDIENRLTQVIILTDGQIGNEEILLTLIEEELGRKTLFSVAIGSSPNTSLLKQISKIGRGTHLHIGNLRETKKKMSSLLNKLQYPALINIKFNKEFSNLNDNFKMFPQKMPDLYYGEPLKFIIKIANSNYIKFPKDFIISGKLNGQTLNWKVDKNDIILSENIHKIFGKENIEQIEVFERQGKIYSGKREIIKIALNHQIVSSYTSLVAVEFQKSRSIDNKLHSFQLEQNFPDGWVWEENQELDLIKSFYNINYITDDSTLNNLLIETEEPILLAMAQTDTKSYYYLIIGVILLFYSFISFGVFFKCKKNLKKYYY